MKSIYYCIILFLASIFTISNAYPCGKERWPVKVGTDDDSGKVDLAPVDTTIFRLSGIPPPGNPNIRKRSRYAPIELSVYRISATMTLIKHEADEDYHIVIKDNRNRTMIVESADPTCAKGSPFEDNIKQVRESIDKHFGGPIAKSRRPNIPVIVSGVAFFDKKHGQTGVAQNGIELHPLLSIEFP
jgi:hypothetical protein